MFEDFGINVPASVTQLTLWLALGVVPSIAATARAVRYCSGPSLTLWVLFIWFVPLIGWLSALIWVRRPKKKRILYRRGMPN